MRHRLGQIHVAAMRDSNHGVARDHAFLKSRQRDERLDRRARLETGGERHLLVDDGKDTAVRGINRDHGAFFVSQSIHSNLANHGIVV